MKIKSIKTILTIIALSLIPHLSPAYDLSDWLNKDSWKNWKPLESVLGYFEDKPSEPKDTTKGKVEDEDEKAHQDAQKLAQASKEDAESNFYDSLGIKFSPEQYLLGTEATRKKHLTTLFEKKHNRSAISYFISVERKNHAEAIAMLDSMNPAHRLIILTESPAQFIAKILVEIRKQDFKGKTLSHWGSFELQSEYFGKKIVDIAEIKGESVSLQYIVFLLGYNTSTKEDYANRAFRLAQILSHVSADDLPSLLVYTNEEAIVKLGKTHKSCFGAVKTKGYCDEETAIYLPTKFIAQLLNFMYTQGMITAKNLVTILETEFKTNQDRFQAILKQIDIKVIQEIIFNFSDEVHPFLPDDIILGAVASIEEKKETLLSVAGGSNASSSTILPASNDADVSQDKEDL